MAFSDAMIGDSDFNPQAATEDLIRQVNGSPLPTTLDPKMLNTRLGRKLGEKPTAATDDEEPAAKELDFSSQAAPASNTQPSDALDFTAQVQPVEAAAPPPTIPITDALHAVHTNIDPFTAGKGFVAGAVQGVGGVAKGLGALSVEAQR